MVPRRGVAAEKPWDRTRTRPTFIGETSASDDAKAQRCVESFLAHVGITNGNQTVFPIWVVGPASGRPGSQFPDRERAADHSALHKAARRSQHTDGRTTLADAIGQRGRSLVGRSRCVSCNAKLTDEKIGAKIFRDALELECPSSKSSFAACSGAGRQLWVRQTEQGARHWCLALLRIHLALRRTWL
jgi:hypothetical protein